MQYVLIVDDHAFGPLPFVVGADLLARARFVDQDAFLAPLSPGEEAPTFVYELLARPQDPGPSTP